MPLINLCNPSISHPKQLYIQTNILGMSNLTTKNLRDVWNIRDLINHSMHRNIHNRFAIVHMHWKWYYHRMYVGCIHTSTYTMLEHVSRSNRFFFHSQFLRGPQLD
jgi:hypothetical protein